MTDTSLLRIVGRRVELDAELAQTLIARGITQLAVDSEPGAREGEFALPGELVHIRCRKLDGVEPVIDVSARTPPPPWSEAKAPNGTPRKLDGQAGQDGVTGLNGGSIHIACQRIESAPRLLACGSPGGDSQGGGNGLKPTTPSANDGKFNKDKTGGTYGGKVLKKFGLSRISCRWPTVKKVTTAGRAETVGRRGCQAVAATEAASKCNSAKHCQRSMHGSSRARPVFPAPQAKARAAALPAWEACIGCIDTSGSKRPLKCR